MESRVCDNTQKICIAERLVLWNVWDKCSVMQTNTVINTTHDTMKNETIWLLLMNSEYMQNE